MLGSLVTGTPATVGGGVGPGEEVTLSAVQRHDLSHVKLICKKQCYVGEKEDRGAGRAAWGL